MARVPTLTIEQFVALLGPALPAPAAERLYLHYRELFRWAPRVSLVGPALEDSKALAAAYSESLLALPELARGGLLLDAGSGAGFPGLVLALADPDRLQVVLVEPRERKAAFLQRVARQAGLRCTVERSPVRHPLPSRFPERLDFVSLRAIKLEPPALDDLTGRLSPGGKLLIWAGAKLPAVSHSLGAPRVLPLPGAASRRIVIWEANTAAAQSVTA